MNKFIGRKSYLADLETLWRKRSSSIVACRGRRRIGKSTLIRKFAETTADRYVEIEGLAPRAGMTNQNQLDNFIATLSVLTGCSSAKVDNWLAAFKRLDEQIKDDERTVVLLDEVSWMGGFDPDFPGVLRNAWETFFHRHDRLIVVVCGSVSSWIRENILGNTGFAGRFSRDYVLTELTLKECVAFWGEAAGLTAPREIFDVLSVTGGVPRYLEEMDPGLSADENIRRMCFLPDGELFKDFDTIFDPQTGTDIPLKIDILTALADEPLSGTELSERLETGRNGKLSTVLKDLQEGGFISDDLGKNPETGGEMRVSKYRLRDNYIRFYLRYVVPHKGEIIRGAFRYGSLEQLPEWDAVQGLQFENLIVNNFREVIPFLGVGNAIVESASPYRNARKGVGGKGRGVQIDLLVQTACSAYVVEVKRKKRIGSEVEDEVREKLRRLPLRKGMSARPALVYCGEIAPVVTGRGYFSALIPAEKLLGL